MISRHEKYIQVDGFCDNVLCPLIGKSSRLLFQVIVVQRFNIQSDKAKKSKYMYEGKYETKKRRNRPNVVKITSAR